MTSDSHLFWFPKTKLLPPQVGHDILPRPRLSEALQTAVTHKHLTLLSATAGSGKTTAVACLLQTDPQLPTGWISLDENDDDPASFLLLLIAALQKIDPACGRTVSEMVQTTLADHNWPRLVGIVINDLLTAVTTPFVLVLDDLHRVSDPTIHQMLDYLLERLPPLMHIVVTTRHDPPLKLSRLRARGQLAEFRMETLRFSPAEMETLFNDVMQLALNDNELSLLHQRTEGWVAGVRLLTLSLPQLKSAEKRTTLIQHLAKSHRFLFDYLVDEVLAHLPAEQRDFLLKTSILTELTPKLCQAVALKRETPVLSTDEMSVAEVAVILQTLYRQNLFMLRNDIDNDDPLTEPTYRYHALFAQFLQKQLRQQPESNVAELHLRAANAETIPERRINHFFAAEAWDKAAELIIDIGKPQCRRNFVQRRVIAWIAAIPAKTRTNFYWLNIIQASYLVERGKLEKGWNLAEEMLPIAQAKGDIEGEFVALRTLAYFRDVTEPKWEKQLQELIKRQPTLLPAYHGKRISFGWGALDQGNWALVKEILTESISIIRAAEEIENYYSSSRHIGPQFLFMDGGINLIKQFDQETLHRFGEGDSLVQAGPYMRAGWIQLLQADLNGVEALIRRARRTIRNLGSFAHMDLVVDWVSLNVMLARAEYGRLQNFVEKAKPRLQQTDTHQRNLPYYLFALWRTNWLQNRLDEAQLVQTQLVALLSEAALNGSPIVSIMAGWQAVAAGKMIEAEEKLLEAVRRHRKHRWIGTWGSARLDLAIFYLQTKRPQQAMAAWQEAAAEMKRLDMPGQPLITGRKVIPLLELAIKENVYPQTAQRALDAFGINAAPRAISIPDSSQSLTPRETETLQLLMTGASNREIAEQLVITQRTVKAHVSNILSKLQVTTRTEAVARAHELSLLQ